MAKPEQNRAASAEFLVRVSVGQTNLNVALTVAGLATVKREFLGGMPRSEHDRLIRAESQARSQKRGLGREAAEAN